MNKKVDEDNVRGGIKRMDDFGSFGGFHGKNYGRTLGVFCQPLTLALGVRYCGRRIQI